MPERLQMQFPAWFGRELDKIANDLGIEGDPARLPQRDQRRRKVFSRSIHWVNWGVQLANGGFSLEVKNAEGEVVDTLPNDELKKAWHMGETRQVNRKK